MNENTTRKPLLIFDLDGTLCDTMPVLTESINRTLTEFSLPTKTMDEVRAAVGNGARTLCRRVLPLALQGDEELVDRFHARYDEIYGELYLRSQSDVYSGVYDAVRTLHCRGYTLAVFSNKPNIFTVNLVRAAFGDEYFALIRGAVDGQPRKPDPEALLSICRTLGFGSSETFMIGDSEPDVCAALAAKTGIVAVGWGYRSHDELISAGATLIVDSAEELCRIFE